MAVASLYLEQFGIFTKARFEFSPGVNVLLGANSTGKTHAMKALYGTLKTFEHAEPGLAPAPRLEAKLARVFRPDDLRVQRLVHRVQGKNIARVSVEMQSGDEIRYSLSDAAKPPIRVNEAPPSVGAVSTFLPSREVLAMYEGFAAAYQNRELAFDETYYDTALALSAPALRGPRPAVLSEVAADLERELGGKVRLIGPRFYVERRDGRMEAQLVAEGLRKVAMIVHLIANGALRDNAVLFWDEPEANLHPALVRAVADSIARLALGGVQIILATHDYLLARTISLWSEFSDVQSDKPPVRFFQLARTRRGRGPVEVLPADDFVEISVNPLLDQYTKQLDIQQRLVRERLERQIG